MRPTKVCRDEAPNSGTCLLKKSRGRGSGGPGKGVEQPLHCVYGCPGPTIQVPLINGTCMATYSRWALRVNRIPAVIGEQTNLRPLLVAYDYDVGDGCGGNGLADSESRSGYPFK